VASGAAVRRVQKLNRRMDPEVVSYFRFGFLKALS
jgi:hypothetical protein